MEHIGEIVDEVQGQLGEAGPAKEGQKPEAAAAPPAAGSPLDLPAEQFQAGLDRRRTNRRALLSWIGGALVEGTDYGSIPTRRGPSKPSLWKPGAEKICGMLGITVHLPTLHEYEKAALQGVQLHHVILRCELHDSAGRVVADGVGARSLKQDQGDLNKTLKMAAKSAHIDATLRMAGLSEVFTQDLEDMAGAAGQQQPAAAEQGGSEAITAEQHRALEARIRELGLDRERVRSWIQRAWGVEHLNEVPAQRFDELRRRLEHWARKQAAEQAQQQG
ncbi:hypothetical protein [Halorhodospira neutriphila]|uniref:ERF family protein n=1 Tax=Halorhodospira neutriphila TaxID=168379 RepID=A0ABS1E8H8_9GAMM|nr:hypothetical protein [Halorhodospira neutriphila]MBK1727094.1 hypothetical protein [Halorhodospira neutriphila]